MKDFLVVCLLVILVVGLLLGLFGAIDWLVRWQTREQTAAIERCIRSGYADAIHHADSNSWLCIGVIDGEWRIKPVELEE